MYTITQWLRKIKDPEMKEFLLRRLNEGSGKRPHKIVNSLINAISEGCSYMGGYKSPKYNISTLKDLAKVGQIPLHITQKGTISWWIRQIDDKPIRELVQEDYEQLTDMRRKYLELSRHRSISDAIEMMYNNHMDARSTNWPLLRTVIHLFNKSF